MGCARWHGHCISAVDERRRVGGMPKFLSATKSIPHPFAYPGNASIMNRVRPNRLSAWAACIACCGAWTVAQAAGMPPETAAQAEATSTLQAQGVTTNPATEDALSTEAASAGASSAGARHAGAAAVSRADTTAAVQRH